MDPELLIDELVQQLLQPPADSPQLDPGIAAEAMFLSRIRNSATDLNQPDAAAIRPRSAAAQGPSFLRRAGREVVNLTPVGDIISAGRALREDHPVQAGIFGALAATGVAGLLRRALLRTAAREAIGTGVERAGIEEGGEAIGALQRELRERRSGAIGRRGAPREGPRGRRASDFESDAVFRDAESAVLNDLLSQARTAGPGQQVDPVTELLRLLEGGGN